MAVVQQFGTPKLTTATTAIYAGPCALIGVFVGTATATPTIAICNSTASTAAAAVVVDAFTPVAGQFYPVPAYLKTGCYTVITGTVDCTFFVSAA